MSIDSDSGDLIIEQGDTITNRGISIVSYNDVFPDAFDLYTLKGLRVGAKVLLIEKDYRGYCCDVAHWGVRVNELPSYFTGRVGKIEI
jgi:hypothetical protein